MKAFESLLKPDDCVMLLIDFHAGLAFGVESIPRQVVLNNAVALARTAGVFNVPVVASTSASRAYSGPLIPSSQDVLPSVKPRRARGAICL
jgi:nicotinamidase-related amidase